MHVTSTMFLADILSAGLSHVRREFQRGSRRADPPCHQVSARRVVVDGTHHVQVLDSDAEEGKAITAIQVQDGLCACASSEAMSQIQLWDVSYAADRPSSSSSSSSSSPSSPCPAAGWRLRRCLGDASMSCVTSMSFERPLGMIVAGCGDYSMRVWDLET